MSSSPSYERINYTIRPAKSIERRMIVEACSRLRSFYSFDSYRYIGFGSPYFSDFFLIHRALGIPDMICIEKEVEDAERFKFNSPFRCIDLKFGTSTEILPALEWKDRPTIIWLDYDGGLNEDVLADVDVVTSNAVSGSFFLLSIRASASDFGMNPEERSLKLQEKLGKKLPTDISRDAFSEANFSSLLWRIIDAEIRYVLSERSAGLRPTTRFEYSQVLHFSYRDGVKMITIGGLIFQIGQHTNHIQCDFSSLPFARSQREPYKIEVPKLTIKELKALNEQLPSSSSTLPSIPKRDIDAYSAIYRYFPIFVETEL